MLCKKCGEQCSDDAVICPKCGEELNATAEEVAAETEVTAEETEIIAQPENEIIEDEKKASKKKKAFLFGAIAAALVVVIAAVAVFFTFFNKSAEESNLSIFVDSRNGIKRICAKVEDNDAVIIKKLADGESFSQNSEFIVKGDNIYYFDDNGGLSVMNLKNGKSKIIGDDFKPGTLVISAKGDTILYTGEHGTLYKTVNGGKAKEIAELGETAFNAEISGQGPIALTNYGFVAKTNEVWYAPVSADANASTVYLESGDVVAENAAVVFAVELDKKSHNVVYLSITSEKTVYPEVDPEEENAEETQPAEPTIERTYGLTVKESGSEPVVLIDNWMNSADFIVLRNNRKGVAYVADKVQAETDPETGLTDFTTGTLKFYEFGKGTTDIESEVGFITLIDSEATNHADYSKRPEDESFLAFKSSETLVFKDLQKVVNPADYKYEHSSPAFFEDNSVMVYFSYTPSEPKAETAPQDGEEVTEPEENVVPVKLMYSKYVNGEWAENKVVIEDISKALDYKYDEDGSKIYYALLEGEDTSKAALYCFATKDGTAVKIADDAIAGHVAFKDNGKKVYYANALDSETQVAKISLYKNGQSTVVAENVSGLIFAENGTPYVVVSKGETSDMLMVNDKNELIDVCKNFEQILFIR